MANIGQDLMNVPFGEMVEQVAEAITEAQLNLDKNTIEIMRVMGDASEAPVNLPSLEVGENGELRESQITTSMIGAGFQPTFYQFAETVIEVKMAVTAINETSTDKQYKTKNSYIGKKRRLAVTPIDATYSNKFNYTQEGASTLRTRLVPVPPNSIIQKQIELKAQYMQLLYEKQIAMVEKKLSE